jgi:hypothetical protein
MAHKRKTVSARLSRYLGPSPYPYIGPEIDWNDPSIWTAAAREAFDLADLERATKIAFSKFHLDPRNPHHWRLLLHFFADAHFGFVCGFALGELLPEAMLPRPDQRLITSLFLGTALSIASVKIVAMVVREMGFMRRKIGMTLVASAIIDDTVGWTIIAVTSSLALHGSVNAGSLAQSVLGTALFLLVSFTLGRRLVFALIRWANDTFISEVPVVTAILIVMGAMAVTTHLIGIHTVLGAFVAGILVAEDMAKPGPIRVVAASEAQEDADETRCWMRVS